MKNVPRTISLLSLLVAGLVAAPARSDDTGSLNHSSTLDLLLKQTGVYDNPEPASRPTLSSIPSGRGRCPITGCSGRSAGSMSTITTMSGSTTGRARSTTTKSGWNGRYPA
jgi:hypothetical protein